MLKLLFYSPDGDKLYEQHDLTAFSYGVDNERYIAGYISMVGAHHLYTPGREYALATVEHWAEGNIISQVAIANLELTTLQGDWEKTTDVPAGTIGFQGVYLESKTIQ